MNNAPSKLTIGMATYDDFDGVYFTLQSLNAHHPRVQYMVVDNAPASCPRTKAVTQAVGGQYVHRPDLVGTSAPRDALFRLANTEWVMCVDSHVLLEPGAVQAMLAYAEDNPESNDLLSGPMVFDDGHGAYTHWRCDQPPALWGVWDHDPRCAPIFGPAAGQPGYLPGLPTLPPGKTAWEVMPQLLAAMPPFDITMQGLGLFAMRTAAWPGFNSWFRGFGGEEGYIHEKVRQLGGRCLCVPSLRWRHRFRNLETPGSPPPPYPLSTADHTWNLLIGHRELGIDAVSLIYEHFGKKIGDELFNKLVAQAEQAQSFGVHQARRRLMLLGVWYTNNNVDEKLLQKSLGTVAAAQAQAMHHHVAIATSSWRAIPGNMLPAVVWRPVRTGHGAIVDQIWAAIREGARQIQGGRFWDRKAKDWVVRDDWDALVFLEHDVLYPPDYFDRIGNALVAGAPVVVNHDYIGMNATGYLPVVRQDEPMHQMAMQHDVAIENLERASREFDAGNGQVELEPLRDRDKWLRLPTRGLMPSVHVNAPGRFTNHGEVCYTPSSGGHLTQVFWGKYEAWWPLVATPETAQGDGSVAQNTGCRTCGQPGVVATPVMLNLESEYQRHQRVSTNVNEHMPLLRELASQCEHVTELSGWLDGALIALASGKPKKLVSACHASKPEWEQFRRNAFDMPTGFVFETRMGPPTVVALEETDLLYISTQHNANVLRQELQQHAPFVRRWIVLHNTTIYGQRGDNGAEGLMVAVYEFLAGNPAWSIQEQHQNNNGLLVLVRNAEPTEPETLEGAYERHRRWVTPIHEHLPALRELASMSKRVIELGAATASSTTALLAGQPDEFTSYDAQPCPAAAALAPLAGITAYRFVIGDSLKVTPHECDLLFIDTIHTAPQLYGELLRWAPLCNRWIVLHDTEVFGEHGEHGQPGLLPALRKYVREHPEWSVIKHYANNNGLTVLSCASADKQAVPSTARRVLNFMKAMAKYKLSGLPVLDEDKVEARLDVCSLCELRTGEHCSKCGCPLIEGAIGQPGKAFIPTEDCPLAKWPAPVALPLVGPVD